MMKAALKTWNVEVFGRVQQEINFLEDKLTHLENSLIDSFSMENELQLMQCRDQYKVWLDREEALWRQKLRIKWLQDGDGNTNFFHASVNNKKKKAKRLIIWFWKMTLN